MKRRDGQTGKEGRQQTDQNRRERAQKDRSNGQMDIERQETERGGTQRHKKIYTTDRQTNTRPQRRTKKKNTPDIQADKTNKRKQRMGSIGKTDRQTKTDDKKDRPDRQ